MRPRKTTRFSDASRDHSLWHCDTSAEAAAIDVLIKRLPDPEAARQLRHLLKKTSAAVCEFLAPTKENSPPHASNVFERTSTCSSLKSVALEIAESLLKFGTTNPEQTKWLLRQSERWPAIASTDPGTDIRKVAKNKTGAAANYYKMLTENLGHSVLFPNPKTRDPGVFHDLAARAAETVLPYVSRAEIYRRSQLPWFLDFTDGSKWHLLHESMPPHDDPSSTAPQNWTFERQKREWVIALKYYLHLTLAPEPNRSELRRSWRHVRERAFRQLKPSGTDELELYTQLRDKKPLAPVKKSLTPSGRGLPDLDMLGDQDSPEPIWFQWWKDTLKFTPDVLFGQQESLIEWFDAEISTKNRKGTKRQPMALFGRCVDATLDAFLHLNGVSEGLKSIVSTADRLPRIRPFDAVPEMSSPESAPKNE